VSVVVIATFAPKDNRSEEHLLGALQESIPEIHREDGCQLFALHKGDQGEIVLIEKWESEQLLDAHLAAEPVANLVRRIEPFIASSPEVTRLRSVAAGTGVQGKL
jgi:quinol monooxygenase YgiN